MPQNNTAGPISNELLSYLFLAFISIVDYSILKLGFFLFNRGFTWISWKWWIVLTIINFILLYTLSKILSKTPPEDRWGDDI